MEKINTLRSFIKEGFKIERNGQVFTLTPEEMSDFRYLDKAVTGRDCLSMYEEIADEDDKKVIEQMINDEDICYNIEVDVLDIALQDCRNIEIDVIEDYIKRNIRG